ncbi:NUDIX hydrolase [Caenispirillum salinarum AK4]|uniref:GDP-mannose pyrophosphatase n=1 Tax=Caenispirillum salinarum AK4 TaxID=1238182 RepID=K9GIU4_9PROT|nr:NUDIX hydrolase [Caenispirillum salinarum AK4]
MTLVARTITAGEGDAPRTFHSLKQADYVSVLAVTADGRVPVVRQYRPTAEGKTLELPAGLLEADETPELCAHRELAEECGLALPEGGGFTLLPVMRPDTGRLENRLWSYFATGVTPVQGWQPEPGMECLLLDPSELSDAIARGAFNHALHIAVIGQAMLSGLFSPLVTVPRGSMNDSA